MSLNYYKQFGMIKSAIIFLLLSTLFLGACKSSFFGEPEISAEPQSQPQTQTAPVVIDGVRTSYADVVDKTSPAVVMIQSERKAQAQSQQFPFGDFFNLAQFTATTGRSAKTA